MQPKERKTISLIWTIADTDEVPAQNSRATCMFGREKSSAEHDGAPAPQRTLALTVRREKEGGTRGKHGFPRVFIPGRWDDERVHESLL